MSTHKIKSIQTELAKRATKIAHIKAEISSLNKQMTVEEKRVKELKKMLENMGKNDTIVVSEHALLRYFERHLGFDLKMESEKMLTPTLLELVGKLGPSGTYPVKELEISVVMKDNTIVTVI